MDPLEISYENLSAVPEAFRGLYTEKDGKAVLTGINGVKTQSDVDTVLESLRKERTDHGKTRDALKPFAGLNATEIAGKMARFDELEAAAAGKIDDKKIEEIVGQRLKMKTGPIETQLREATDGLSKKDQEIADLRGQLQSRDRNDVVRTVASKLKVRPEAVADVEMAAERMMQFDELGRLVTKDGINGISPGLDMEGFLKAMVKMRPHWWPDSEGGGSRGGSGGGVGGKNPWSKDNWSLSDQGRVLTAEGREAADRYAKAAGSYVGATGPATK